MTFILIALIALVLVVFCFQLFILDKIIWYRRKIADQNTQIEYLRGLVAILKGIGTDQSKRLSILEKCIPQSEYKKASRSFFDTAIKREASFVPEEIKKYIRDNPEV